MATKGTPYSRNQYGNPLPGPMSQEKKKKSGVDYQMKQAGGTFVVDSHDANGFPHRTFYGGRMIAAKPGCP